MTTLLIADHDNAALSAETAKALTAATALGAPVDILVAGSGAAAVAEEAAKLSGVQKVLHAEDVALEHALAEPMAALILSLADGYDAFVAPATTTGKNIMPRVAALLDVMQVSDIIAVDSPDTFQRPIYAGNAIQTVRSTDAKKVITVRGTAFDAAAIGGSAPVETVSDPRFARCIELCFGRSGAVGAPGTHQREGHPFGRARAWLEGRVRARHPAACRCAGRSRWRFSRSRGCWLRAQ
jgi:electron transfer flavoprotein alpha subunit